MTTIFSVALVFVLLWTLAAVLAALWAALLWFAIATLCSVESLRDLP